MRDRPLIFAGLFLFVALFTFPMWRGGLAGTFARQPELKLPATQKTCVLPRAQMRQQHMQLLMTWREDAVRHGQLTYTADDGKRYDVSLSKTCISQCHNNKAEFCDRCHQYAAVSGPYCFDCHVDPTPKTATGLAARAPDISKIAGDTHRQLGEAPIQSTPAGGSAK
jgi:hypothetical protein